MRRFVTLLAMLSIASTVAAQPAATAREQYIVVLKQPNLDRPDVAALGGSVDNQVRETMIVSLPASAVEALRAHASVRYVQRVVTGPDRRGIYGSMTDDSVEVSASGDREITTNAAPPTWNSGQYVYDGAGNIVQIGTADAPDADGKRSSFVYDPVGRLVRMNVAGTAVEKEETYEYDGFGNLKQITTNGSLQARGIDAATNRLAGELYDTAGNQTRNGSFTFDFDPFNMLRSRAGASISDLRVYVYTADDERVGVRVDEGDNMWHWSIRDLEGRVLRQYRAQLNPVTWSDVPWTWVEDYVWRDDVLLGGERVTSEGGRRHFHIDHLGSIRMTTSATGAAITLNDYYAYGSEVTPADQEQTRGYERDDPMRFTGHERDYAHSRDAELDYMHARYYSARSGRFLSPDPLLGNLLTPGSWNRYAYVLGNPVNLIDPYGLKERGPGERMQPGDTCVGVVVDNVCYAGRIYEQITVTGKGGIPLRWLISGLPASSGQLPSPYRYESAHAAAIAAIGNICGTSVRLDREFGGMILESGGRFGFSAPIIGRPHNANNAFGKSSPIDVRGRMYMLPPPGVRMVATYHTHGADSSRTAAGRNYNYRDERISDQDISSSVRLGLPVYVGTPSGRVLTFGTQMRSAYRIPFDTQIGTVPCR